MGQRMSNNICCSTRDKNDRSARSPSNTNSQFWYAEVELRLDEPRMVSFAPFWSSESPVNKRLAVGSTNEVHVYNIREDQLQVDLPRLRLEHKWTLPDNAGAITALLFTEETNSKFLAIAATLGRKNSVRIFAMDPSPLLQGLDFKAWSMTEGFSFSLDEHKSPIQRMVISPQYLLSADVSGVCYVWHKDRRSFQRKGSATLHTGGVVDLVTDRLFAYSAGLDDRSVSVWSLPDLTLVQTIVVEIPKGIVTDVRDNESSSSSSSLDSFVRITQLRKPLSRWAGAQSSSRHSPTPTGMLYITGLLTSAKNPAKTDGECAGVLMEWTLGAKPACQCAQFAHDNPIVSLVYGPEDNGPLITADTKGMFRVWDTVPRLNCSQQVRVVGNELEDNPLAVVVEPQNGLYTTIGDKRLFIWRRHHPGDLIEPM